MNCWNPVWHQAITRSLFEGKAFGSNKTVIFSLRMQCAGEQIRFYFSNRFGTESYQIGPMKLIAGGKSYPVTVRGDVNFQIPVGKCVRSDAVPVDISVGDTIEVRMYYSNAVIDCNMIEEEATLLKGNQVDACPVKMEKPFLAKILGAYNAIPSLESVEVLSNRPSASIVAFGDSITALNRWTKPLAQRLESAYPGEYVLLNSGISGNCLLHEEGGVFGPVFGEMGTKRFQRDVLDIPNLHTVILGLGVNDVSYYSEATRNHINLECYKDAITKIVQTLHERNVRVVMQTITPRLGVALTMGVYKREMEEQRLLFNDWIRNAGIFDYLFDAEAVVKEKHPDGLYYREGLHQGDRLHPNAAGGRLLADSFDLEKLTGKPVQE